MTPTEINPACCGEKGCGMAEKCAPSVCEHGQLARQCWVCELEAECDKQKQLAAHWLNMAAMHKAERDEARAECERLRYTNKILAERSFELQTNLTAVLEGKNNDIR